MLESRVGLTLLLFFGRRLLCSFCGVLLVRNLLSRINFLWCSRLSRFFFGFLRSFFLGALGFFLGFFLCLLCFFNGAAGRDI